MREIGWLQEEEALLEEAKEQFPDQVRVLRALSHVDQLLGEGGRVESLEKEISELEQWQLLPATRENYRRIVQMVEDAGAKFVAVQYPMRKIDPLKKMLEDSQAIIYVDNEVSFKEAVTKGLYEDYFTDSFAGDFGHCTDQGNALLAENVATSILIEIEK